MKLSVFMNNLQHVGLPTLDIEKTIAFYEGLGAEVEYRTVLMPGETKVAFLRLSGMQIETYEEKEVAGKSGAINHIAIDCTDIQAAYKLAVESGYEVVSNGIESLPFWANGVSFFIILGPNAERIEFCQKF